MNDITKKLLSMISDISGEIKGAFNIREDQCEPTTDRKYFLQKQSIT